MNWLDAKPSRWASLVFLLTLFVYLASPVRQVADSNYSMLVSESLLQHGTVRLDDYVIPRFNSDLPPQPFPGHVPYQLQRKQNHAYYVYPLGSSILSLPYVAAMNLIGIAAVDANGVFDFWGEAKIECSLAALLMAALALIFLRMGRLLLPARYSALIALAAAFGTQMWSTASRGLWSDTWGILLIGLVTWMLLDAQVNKRALRPVLLATLLAWAYFVRPTYCVPAVTVSVYVLATRPRDALRFVLTGLAWLAAFVAWSWSLFRQLLPDYFQASQLKFTTVGAGLAGTLFSPSRGLLIFVPAVAVVAYVLLRYRRDIAHPRLAACAVVTIALHLVVVAGFPAWYAGHCYGARYTTGLVPWFVLLAILGVQAARTAHLRRARAWRAECAAACSVLVLGVLVNANGALNKHTAEWNFKPVNIDAQPQRVWDWRDPQFLVWSR